MNTIFTLGIALLVAIAADLFVRKRGGSFWGQQEEAMFLVGITVVAIIVIELFGPTIIRVFH